MSNESIVHLSTATDIDFSKLISLEDIKVAAANFDMVHQLEEILIQWFKQIEQVGKIKISYLLLTHEQLDKCIWRENIKAYRTSWTAQCD